ncbi:MAG: M4 family metallopeptidase [Cytophagaceae bacterium]|nr:M4 family metallopeptidase [Cytophagaceae bacterium]
MKKTLLPLLLVLSQVSFAQISRKEQNDELKNNAKQIRLQEHSSTPSFIRFRDDYSITPEKAIEYSKSFFTSANASFAFKNQQKSKNAKWVYKYEQTIAGYPVEFTSWHVHVKNNRVVSMNGDIVDAPNFDAVFSLLEHDALQIALKHIGAELYMWQDKNEELLLKKIFNNNDTTYYPSGVKVITPTKPELNQNELRTAYRFNIFSKKPYNRKMVYVDAQTGEILFDLPLIHFSSETATAHTQYSGIREITTEYYDDEQVYVLEDMTRGQGIVTLNCMDGIDYLNAEYFMDDDNIWNNVNEEQDEYATDAHFATMSTYDYYSEIHGRNSIDNAGHPLISMLHFDLIEAGAGNNVNAFWAGSFMIYGDGDLSMGITPLTTVDICGHEITHGLTQHTANLVYANESGALNEAFSDIFGAAIEFYTVPENADWTIGEDMGMIFRSIQNPKEYQNPNTYHGEHWVFTGEDEGGVHTNSGVLNYWFYLLCEGGTGVNDNGNAYEVTGIGIEKAEQIAYKMLTEYLTRTSQYHDAYVYAVEAANELYGNCSPETQAVGDAFYAVGVINEPFVITVTADFEASMTEFCKAPAEVTFTNKSENGISYLWNFGDGNTSTDYSPVHVYEHLGNYTVTLTVDGGACGSEIEIKEDFIKVDDALPCVTIMLTNGALDIEECEGIIYDSGGANQNYASNSNSRLIIHAPGAESIVLEIEEFDIETGSANNCNRDYIAFYDGNSINAPLINDTRYCNTTGNPGTISSTGEYITIHFVTNRGGAFAGYKIAFHCNEGSDAISKNILETIAVTPNPSTGVFNITGLENGIDFRYTVTNISGAIIVASKPVSKTGSIDLTALPNGVYFLQIETNNGKTVRKIVKN